MEVLISFIFKVETFLLQIVIRVWCNSREIIKSKQQTYISKRVY